MQALIILFLIAIILILILFSYIMDNAILAICAAVICFITAWMVFDSGITQEVGLNITDLPDNVTTIETPIKEQVAPSYNNYFALLFVILGLWLFLVSFFSKNNEQSD